MLTHALLHPLPVPSLTSTSPTHYKPQPDFPLLVSPTKVHFSEGAFPNLRTMVLHIAHTTSKPPKGRVTGLFAMKGVGRILPSGTNSLRVSLLLNNSDLCHRNFAATVEQTYQITIILFTKVI